MPSHVLADTERNEGVITGEGAGISVALDNTLREPRVAEGKRLVAGKPASLEFHALSSTAAVKWLGTAGTLYHSTTTCAMEAMCFSIRFVHRSRHLRQWQATNNAAERAGRAFRHGQAAHFSPRTEDSIKRALEATANSRKLAAQAKVELPASRAWHGGKQPEPVPV